MSQSTDEMHSQLLRSIGHNICYLNFFPINIYAYKYSMIGFFLSLCGSAMYLVTALPAFYLFIYSLFKKNYIENG